jgi:hypothetical protein
MNIRAAKARTATARLSPGRGRGWRRLIDELEALFARAPFVSQ